MDRTLFSLKITETTRNREYWATRSWVNQEARDKVRAASIVIVPWEKFRPEVELAFPQGTTSIFKSLGQELPGQEICIGVDVAHFYEVALHGREWRLPTLVMSTIVLPIFLGVVSARIDKFLPDAEPKDAVQLELIVEGAQGKCISIKYKGPRDRMAYTIGEEVKRCFPAETSKKAPAAKKKRKPKHQ